MGPRFEVRPPKALPNRVETNTRNLSYSFVIFVFLLETLKRGDFDVLIVCYGFLFVFFFNKKTFAKCNYIFFKFFMMMKFTKHLQRLAKSGVK